MDMQLLYLQDRKTNWQRARQRTLKCVKAKSVFTKGERLEYNYRALSHFTISLSETESESAHTDETTTALDFYHSVSL